MRRPRRTFDRDTYLVTVSSPDDTAAFQKKAFTLHGAVMGAIEIVFDKRFKNAGALSLTIKKLRTHAQTNSRG